MKPLAGNDRDETPGETTTLEFQQVSFRGTGETSLRMRQFTDTIRGGELVIVPLRRQHDPRDLASAILGLYPLDSGTLRFLGEDWLGTEYPRHFRMRSRVGRVFAGSAWVKNMTVLDNVLLPMLHQGIDDADAIDRVNAWVGRLSGRFNRVVDRIMTRRPTSVEPSMLQVCQLIRACCNEPRLLILERPLQYMVDSLIGGFVSVLDQLCSEGVSVLLFADEGSEKQLAFQTPVRRWSLRNSTVMPVGAAS